MIAARGLGRDRWPLAVAAAGFATSVALFWPGVAMYDTVAQYAQVTSGRYDDWHPPAMARLWALIAPLRPGAAPMLLLQLGGYWLGIGLIADALASRGMLGRTLGVLGIALMPPLLGWQGVVLKDCQMAAALIAAVGLVAGWRLRGRPVPRWGWAVIGGLVVYATLVRANAVFATVPLIVALLPWPTGWVRKAALSLVAMPVVIALSPVIGHQLFGAAPSGVERTQALFDLAGIAVRVPGDTAVTPAERAVLIERHCVTPFFWDPLGDETHCGPVMARLRALPVGALYITLAATVVRHPVAYGEHRLAHLNSTERWLVPRRWPGAAPPAVSEPNAAGLASPGQAAAAWQAVAAALIELPIGWPVLWVAIGALLAVSLARSASSPRRDLALALLASALTLEASFALLSIASDWRYHLWSIVAIATATALGVDRMRRRAAILSGGLIAIAIVIATGAIARLTMPVSPQSYQGMLGAVSTATAAISRG